MTIDNLRCTGEPNDGSPGEPGLVVEQWQQLPLGEGSTLISTANLTLCNDKLRFWTNGSMLLDLQAGSADVRLETNNIIGITGVPTEPPPGFDVPAIFYNYEDGSMYVWDTNGLSWTPASSNAQGVTGVGVTGPQGIQGLPGSPGATGVDGIQGATGVDGIQGATGVDGIHGVTGADGLQGVTGADGLQGVTGVDGLQGATGVDGKDGFAGSEYNILSEFDGDYTEDTSGTCTALVRKYSDTWISVWGSPTALNYARAMALSGNGNLALWSRVVLGNARLEGKFIQYSKTPNLKQTDLDNNYSLPSEPYSIRISENASRVVVGMPFASGGLGEVHVLSYVFGETNLTHLHTFTGTVANEQIGNCVAINSDGTRIAFSGYRKTVKVYKFDGATWTQVGSDIGTTLTERVAINGVGDVVVVGFPSEGNGTVRVYASNFYTGAWTQTGSNLTGATTSDDYGYDVDITKCGTRFIVGTLRNRADIVDRTYTTNTVTHTFTGTTNSFGESVRISAGGSRVIIGEQTFGGVSFFGRVQIYEYTDSWNLIHERIGLGNDRLGIRENVPFNSTGNFYAVATDIITDTRTINGYYSDEKIYRKPCGESVSTLTDTDIASASHQQVLMWDGITGNKWVNREIEDVVAGASGVYSIQIGISSTVLAGGDDAVVIGRTASGAYRGVCVGAVAKNSNSYGTSVGWNTESGTKAVSVGSSSKAQNNSVCVGNLAGSASTTNNLTGVGYEALKTTAKIHATAIGYGAGLLDAGESSFSGGHLANASGTRAIALGYDTDALGQDSIAIGGSASRSAKAEGGSSIAMSQLAWARGNASMALLYDAQTFNDDCIAIGNSSRAGVTGTATNCISIGKSATTAGIDAISIGNGAQSVGNYSVRVGSGAKSLTQTVSIGRNAGSSITSFSASVGDNAGNSCGSFSTNIGPNSGLSSGTNSVSVGHNADGYGANSVSIGKDSEAGATGAIAIGNSAIVTVSDSITIGNGNNTANPSSVMIGMGTVRNGSSPSLVAIGTGASSGGGCVAIGLSSYAHPGPAVAVGSGARANNNSVAIGGSAGASTQNSLTAVGYNTLNTTPNNFSTAIGYNAGNVSAGQSSVSVGHNADGYGANSVSIGKDSEAGNTGAIAIGDSTITRGANSLSMLYDAQTFNDDCIAIGNSSRSGATGTGTGSIAIGKSASSIGLGRIAIGQAEVDGDYGVAIGAQYTTVSAKARTNAVAIGRGSKATNSSVVLGYRAGANSTTSELVAIGQETLITNPSQYATAIGHLAGRANAGESSVSVGHNADGYGANSVSIGKDSEAGNTGAIAIGDLATATGNRAITLGVSSTTSGTDSITIGSSSTSTHNGGINLGYNCTSSADNELKIRLGDSNTTEIRTNLVLDPGPRTASGNYLTLVHNGTTYYLPLYT